MTLDEAIKHAEEVADAKLQDAELSEIQGCYNNAKKCVQYAKEHRQLAEWLKELKQLREQTRWTPVSKKSPKNGERLIDDDVLVSCEDGKVRIGFCMGEDEIGNREWAAGGKIFSEPVAWMPLPKPYEPQESGEV